jgi:hypothetical protein
MTISEHQNRPLNSVEEDVLDYILLHEGRNTEDIANHFEDAPFFFDRAVTVTAVRNLVTFALVDEMRGALYLRKAGK